MMRYVPNQLVCVCVCECVCVCFSVRWCHMSVGAHGRKEVLNPQEVKLQVIVNRLMWCWQSYLGPPGRPARALSWPSLHPLLISVIYKKNLNNSCLSTTSNPHYYFALALCLFLNLEDYLLYRNRTEQRKTTNLKSLNVFLCYENP